MVVYTICINRRVLTRPVSRVMVAAVGGPRSARARGIIMIIRAHILFNVG